MKTYRSTKRVHPSARLKFHGLHVASIGRAAFEAIADEPVFSHHQGPPGAKQVTFRALLERVPARDQRRRIRFGAGLLEHVVTALKAKGFDVHGNHPVPWPWVGGQSPETRCPFLDRAAGRMGSLAVVPKLADRIRIIAELCRLHPDANILVVARNNREVRAIANSLELSTERVVSCTPAIPNGHPWVHVISSGGLSSCSSMYWNFIIFVDAELALSSTAAEHLASCSGSARIGLLGDDERKLLSIERCTLEAVFGPVIYRSGNDTARTEIRVAWLQPTNVPKGTGSFVDCKRSQVWTNVSRNQLIARAAQSLSESDRESLNEFGLQEAANWRDSGGQQPTVAVIVENLEHGQQLAPLLPNWRLEAVGYVPPCGCMVSHDQMILTIARAAETLVATNVVVYAAGGTDSWFEGIKLATSAWPVTRRLIVDVEDHHNTGLPRNAGFGPSSTASPSYRKADERQPHKAPGGR